MSLTNVTSDSAAQATAKNTSVPPGIVIPPDELVDGQLFHPRTVDIRVKPGFNPRTFFDSAKHESLTASVAAEGVVQPIIVRPDPDDPNKFIIVAGERRWRAACAAGLETIPAIFRDVNERRALAIAAVENYERDEVSPAEEAKLARRMLDGCDGDRETARKELGWRRRHFDSRLALNHGTESVLNALAERRIKVGHAELLVTLPAETQDGTLEKVLEDQISVADLKAKLASFTQLLSAAIFDKSDCRLCPHNSSLQAELFDHSVGDGHCANRACFGAKTTEALRQQQEDLQGEYNCVFVDLDRSPETWTPLCKTGSNGVGAQQYTACQGCEHFGALISSRPGEEGQVERGICFHLPCNKEKVAEQQARVGGNGKDEADPDTYTAGQAGGSPVGTRKKTTKKPSAASRPRKIEDAVNAFLRKTASDTVRKDSKLVKSLVLYSLLDDAKWPSVHPDGMEALSFKPSSRNEALEQCYQLDESALDAYIVEGACQLIGNTHDAGSLLDTAVSALRLTNTDLAGVFELDEGFLRTHTKAAITSLMNEPLAEGEASFATRYDRKFGKGAFAKLMRQKTDKIVARILGSKFDFTRFVPRCVAERLEPAKTRRR